MSNTRTLVIDYGSFQLRVGGHLSDSPVSVTNESLEGSDVRIRMERLQHAAPSLASETQSIKLVVASDVDLTLRGCSELIVSCFESFPCEIESVFLIPVPLATLIAAGHTSGIVIDAGHRDTRLTQITDGLIDFARVVHSPLGGSYLNTFFIEEGTSVCTLSDIHTAKCYVSMPNVDFEIGGAPAVNEGMYTLPDGKVLDVRRGTKAIQEEFFTTNAHHASLPDLIEAFVLSYQSVSPIVGPQKDTSKGTNSDAMNPIVCAGGCFCVAGMHEQLISILNSYHSEQDSTVDVNNNNVQSPLMRRYFVTSQDRPDWMPWFGAALTAQLTNPSVVDRALTKEEYFEFGPELAYQKFYAQ